MAIEQLRHASPNQSLKYQTLGKQYEKVTYGKSHLQLYRRLRNEAIGAAIRESFSTRAELDILEVGCGTGLVLEYLTSLPGRHHVHGLDGSSTMLSQAAARFEHSQTPPRLMLGSADALPFEAERFDVVVATRFIHLFSHDKKKQIFAEFLRVLRPGGIAIVEFYARPHAVLRYCFGGARGKSRNSFFSHYPTRDQVTDITGTPLHRRPIRLVGSRVLYRVIGERWLAKLTRSHWFPNISPLVDEYLVVTRK